MKKKVALGITLLTLLIFGTGCQFLEETASPKFDYQDFSSVVDSPDRLNSSLGNSWLDKKLTFDAYITSEPFEMQSDSEEINGKQFISVVIARNTEKAILVNVDGLEDVPKEGYIHLTGKVVGSIYTTGNDGMEEYVNIDASKISSFEPEDKKAKDSNTFTNENKVDYEFVKAIRTVDTFGKDAVIIYYNVDNKGDQFIFTGLDQFFIYQENEFVDSATLLSSEGEEALDPAAVPSITKIDQGMHALSYVAYALPNSGNEISVCVYDDQFGLIFEQDITIEE